MKEGEKRAFENQDYRPPEKKDLIVGEIIKKLKEKEATLIRVAIDEAGCEEVVDNFKRNAQNFRECLGRIPLSGYDFASIQSLIEALNGAGGNFVGEGEVFNLRKGNGQTDSYEVLAIFPPNAMEEEEGKEKILGFRRQTKGSSLMTGINFWDKPIGEGSLFIPAIYVVRMAESASSPAKEA